MEGYSVTEAASVLGVPTERVWELLARGILSGAPDGETGMRVFLQPRPAPTPPAIEEPRRPNGGRAREPEVEASPFRELLTEFRNLTERYGQALLALGEARGEVASLRSRVDLLEARFDLRLPMSGTMPAAAPSAAGWASTQPLATPEAEAPAPTAEAEHVPEAVEAPPRRKRGRGHRRATDDFAEALARAEDPSPAELPGAAEAAAAFAALRDEAAADEPETERAGSDFGLPREPAAAESMAVAEAGLEATLEATLEAEGELAEAAVAAAPEPAFVEPEPAEVAAAIEPVPEPHLAVEPEPEPAVDAAVEPERSPEVRGEARPTEPAPEPTVAAAAAPEAQAEPQPTQPTAPEPIEAEIAESGPQPEPEAEIAAQRVSEVEPAVDVEPEPIAAAAPEVVAPEPAAPAPVPEPESVREAGEASWDRERYSARIEEPDWIPEEREPVERAESTADQVEAVAAQPPQAVDESAAAPPDEPVSPAATRGADEETVLWFERDLGLAPPWPQEDDPAAEIEVASTGARTTPSFEPPNASEPPPESRAEATTSPATLRIPPTQAVRPLTPPTTASRAYRRLRRIFPG